MGDEEEVDSDRPVPPEALEGMKIIGEMMGPVVQRWQQPELTPV
jgi:hypothetical protein